MGLQPKIDRERKFLTKQCGHCGNSFGDERFAPSKSIFVTDGVIPWCDDCVDEWIESNGGDWSAVDKMCQYANIPFIPKEWERIKELAPSHTFHKYAEVFDTQEYAGIEWQDYYEQYKELQSNGSLAEELPGLSDEVRRGYRERWGAYDDDGYQYLENLYKGLITTQNVNGALQVDQAIKICKISYEIDKRIEEGTDFDKLLASYDKLVKAADFTPKNVKNINDFDTVGELVRWMEKKNWKNGYYDNVKRDIVDETIANIQNFNRRLYTNESGIGDDINHRIEQLKTASSLENDNYYGTDLNVDLDNYDNTGYEDLIKEDEFQVDVTGDDSYEY